MIEITLKELNESYAALLAVSRCITGAPLKFRLLPVVRYAKQHIEDMNAAISELAGKHGAEVLGENKFNFENIKDAKEREKAIVAFEQAFTRFMKSETVQFKTDKSKYLLSEVTKCESKDNPTNAADLAFLEWLFTFDMDEAKSEEKAASASA